VDRGRWCPTCANASKAAALRTNTIEIAERIAEERGGRCLSEVYENNYVHLRWQCHEAHEWTASLNKVKDVGRWCPVCPAWKRETECRTLFEELTGRSFPPLAPAFLQGLRYDGFCADLRIAFEHNGIQHYEETPFFHRTNEAFDRQIGNDRLKDERSTANWVALVIVPYWIYDLRAFIGKELRLLGVIKA
jgi:hypothetical protein